MKTVTLIATGGTIASNAKSSGGPVNAGLAGESLLASLHEPLEDIAVKVENFEAVGSYALDLETVHRLCARISEVLAEDAVDGVVVTHGTDTMEESAFLADILVSSDKPVVFTGAQRHAGVPDTDGPRNIADAIRCAASDGLRAQGAVILFEGDIHAARDVTKAHTSRVDTFRSIGLGKLGEVDDGRVYLYRRTATRLHVSAPVLDPGVELMLVGLGSAPDFLDYCESTGKSGLVLAAFGRGNAPRGFADRIQRLTARGIPVVVASRCAEGRTLPVYGGDSGGRTLEDAGVIFAGTLSAIKARLILSALLGAGAEETVIRATFQDANRTA
ncbi:asparaginase [Stappia sp. ES.058]|uniref:asparaginase n=1 Tax=Stappia sp. ES.058 TaxID=1881061 RepID=UPI00087A2B9E|nr:asparaginase [Stappia sp. ES.058]SDU48120.1 asparaginase [Stappia sp. ES.058]